MFLLLADLVGPRWPTTAQKKSDLLIADATTQSLLGDANGSKGDVLLENGKEVVGHAHDISLLRDEELQLLTHGLRDVRLDLGRALFSTHG